MPFPSYILRPLVFSISILMIEWGVFPTLFIFIALISLTGTEIRRQCFVWKFSKSPVLIAIPVVVLVTLWGVFTGTFNLPENPVWLILYLPWSLFQEFIVFCFIYENLEAGLKGVSLRVVVSAIFSIFHLPNVFLLVGTFFMIFAFSGYYEKNRTVLLPAIIHYVLAIAVSLFVPESVTHSLKVGINCCR